MSNKRQNGFSLIELLLGTLLMVLVFAFFGTFLFRLQRSAVSYTETAKQNDDALLSFQTLGADLENAGSDLTMFPNQPFAGKIFLPFYAHSAYSVENNRISPLTPETAQPLRAAVKWKGKGRLTWEGGNFDLTLTDRAFVYRLVFTEGKLEISRNGLQAASAETRESTFVVENSVIGANGNETCRVAVSVGGNPVFENFGDCGSDDGREIGLNLSSQGWLTVPELEAPEIILRESQNYPVRLPLLPFYGDDRLELPWRSERDGFVIIGGDQSFSAGFTTENVRFVPGDTQALILSPDFRPAENAVLLVCDYLQNRSVLLQVISASDNVYKVIPVTAPGMNRAGFGKLYSAPADFADFDFAVGTRVVVLAKPVAYKFATEAGGRFFVLYRRIGDDAPWEPVTPVDENYSFKAQVSATQISFTVVFNTLNETVETALARPREVRLSINPRSLNRTFDAR